MIYDLGWLCLKRHRHLLIKVGRISFVCAVRFLQRYLLLLRWPGVQDGLAVERLWSQRRFVERVGICGKSVD